MNQIKSMLLVDDEPNITRSIKRICRGKGYDIHVADSAEEALKIIQERPIQVVLSDQLMPKMTGAELFEQIQNEYPSIVRILLTGYSAIEGLTSAVNKGAVFRILFKPWDDENLIQTIDEAFEYHFVRAHNQELTDELKTLNANLEQKIAEKTRDLSLHVRRLQLSQTLFELLPSLSVGISDDFHIVTANHKAHEVIGSPALIGQHINDVFNENITKLIYDLQDKENKAISTRSINLNNKPYAFSAIKTEISKNCFAYLLYASE